MSSGIPKLIARSLPLPQGIIPRAEPVPVPSSRTASFDPAAIPFNTRWTVPSPPAAITRATPAVAASRAARSVSSAEVVSRISTPGTPRLLSERSRGIARIALAPRRRSARQRRSHPGASVLNHAPILHTHSACQHQPDRFAVDPMLFLENARRKRRFRVAVFYRHRGLQDDRAVIQILVDKMHGASTDLHAVLERLALRL